MDDRREELAYRKINQLTALLIAGGAMLVLLVGIVAILLHGQLRHTGAALSDLERRVAELERPGQQAATGPPESAPASAARTETPPAPPAVQSSLLPSR